MSNAKQKIEYDSNPFTISFRGFGLLIDYAKGVFVALIIFGMLGFVANMAGSIADVFVEESNYSSQSTSTRDNEDLERAVNTASDINLAAVGAISLFVIAIFIAIIALSSVFNAAYKGFVAAGTVAASERRMITAGEAFSAMGNRFGVLFIAELIALAKIIGGTLLFIVPGIRAQLRYQSTPYLIMKDASLSASQAISRSKELYQGHLMEVFGIMTVGAIIPFIGNAISASGMALNVQQVSAFHAAKEPTPKTHWLNYIGLIFIALIFLFIVGVALLLAVALSN